MSSEQVGDQQGNRRPVPKLNREIVRVRDAMHRDFDRMDGMTTVLEAMSNLKYPERKAIIINKRHDDDENGIVMISDIGRKVVAGSKSPKRVSLYELMSKPYISVDPQMDVRYAARLFEQFRLARVPVVENREVVGIVSFTDLVLRGFEPYLAGKNE